MLMSEITIYHNPRCSKSRATLALLQEHGHDPVVVEYLQTPPDRAQLATLQQALAIPLASMMRSKDSLYRELGLDSADDAARLDALVEHPALLERPIVTCGARAAIGRPPEQVLTIMGQAGE